MSPKITPKSKAASINFDDAPPTDLPARPNQRPFVATAPGQALHNADLRQKLDQANEVIEQWKDALPVRALDPASIRHSRWANRLPSSLEDESFAALREEIKSAGTNVQPIKVRPIDDPKHSYEIVFGHRRHKACSDLGLPVQAMIQEMTDKQLFVEMEWENKSREDLRPYEQGLMYHRALQDGLFSSARNLAEVTKTSLSNVTVALKLARLPEVVLSAFVDRKELQFRWAAHLTDAIERRPDEVFAEARAIAAEGPRPSAKEVFMRLVRSGLAPDPTATPFLVKVTSERGESATLKVNPASNAMSIEIKHIDPGRASEVENLLKTLLH